MARHAPLAKGPRDGFSAPQPRAPRRRRIRSWLGGLAAALCALLLALGALGWAVVDTAPAFTRTDSLTPRDLWRLRSLAGVIDEMRQPDGPPVSVDLRARELDLVVQEASARLLKGSARLGLRPAAADFALTLPVPRSRLPWPVSVALPQSAWIHLSGSARESVDGLPELSALRIGRLPVPPAFARWALLRVADRYGHAESLAIGMAMVQRLAIREAGVTATLRRDAALADSLRRAWVSDALRRALRVFHERLLRLAQGAQPVPAHSLSAGGTPTGPLHLAPLVASVFQLAAQRTAEFSGDETARLTEAALQNRAALLVLALYVNGHPLSRVLSEARTWPQPAVRPVLGAGREDRPQHLLLAAVLTAEANGRLADALGILKEVSDRSSAGSGFSFDDLAVDRAGRRLGELALRDPIALQRRLAAVTVDAELLPDTVGLPSFLDEAAFREAIGEEGSPRYQALMRDIEARVAAVPALR